MGIGDSCAAADGSGNLLIVEGDGASVGLSQGNEEEIAERKKEEERKKEKERKEGKKTKRKNKIILVFFWVF